MSKSDLQNIHSNKTEWGGGTHFEELSPFISPVLVVNALWSLLYYARILFIVVGGAVAQSVEHTTPGEDVSGSIPAVATRSLLIGSVSV